MADPLPHKGQVGVKVDATKALAKLRGISTGLTARDLLSAIGQNELRWTSQNLQKAGQVEGGTPWPKMAPMTLRMRPTRKSEYHFSSPYQTLLEQSMVMAIDEGAASVRVGTAARYAVDHHLGVPSRRLPARPLVGAPAPARARAFKIVQAIVQVIIKKAATS